MTRIALGSISFGLSLSAYLLDPFDVYGPGFISYADPGVLERVAERRIQAGWNLTGDWTAYDVLVAPSDCQLLDRDGWLIVDGEILTIKIVDCAQKKHRQEMIDNGLLADVNMIELAHKNGWLILNK